MSTMYYVLISTVQYLKAVLQLGTRQKPHLLTQNEETLPILPLEMMKYRMAKQHIFQSDSWINVHGISHVWC